MKRKTAIRALCALTLCAAMLFSGAAALAEGAAVVTKVVKNSAPIAKNIECTTYRSVPVTGAFEATDPDGDEVAFAIANPPKYGEAEMSGDCAFLYTPHGRKGSDSFTYVAIDAHGNVSAEATVTVTIKKQATSVAYSDMEGNSGCYAALRLAEAGVFVGEKLGDEYFFEPDSPVSRGEFLALCISACGGTALEGVETTGFYDDDDIPSWAKPYVAAALMEGSISGYEDENGQTVFSAGSGVTFAEAAVMLNNTLGVSDVVSAAAIDEAACPAWAYQATANLSSCGVLSAAEDYTAPVSRAEAAEMLCAALDVLDGRSDGGFWSWLG